MPVRDYVYHERFDHREVPIALDSESSGARSRSTSGHYTVSYVWSMVVKGMQVCLRPSKVGVDVEAAEQTQVLQDATPEQPAEDFFNDSPGVDQGICNPMPRGLGAEARRAGIAEPLVRVRQERTPGVARSLLPRSYFDWFVFITVVQALTVVPLVWILAFLVF